MMAELVTKTSHLLYSANFRTPAACLTVVPFALLTLNTVRQGYTVWEVLVSKKFKCADYM
jgi:hypothetical protein